MPHSTLEQELNTTGNLVWTNRGVSMMPLLRENRDLMILEKRTPPYRKYDVVLFRRDNGQYVLHRILKVRDNHQYWIVGDNCISGEDVREDKILAVMTGVVRDGKQTDCEKDPAYNLYVRLWCAPYPVRFLILRVKFKAGRVWRRLNKIRREENR